MINNLSLINFRRFKSLDIDFNKQIVIFVGDNAVGKTSILESIYIAGITKSHKTNKEIDVINKDEMYSVIEINHKFKMIISQKGKKVFINNVEKKKLSEYIGNLYVSIFSPEDLNIVKGSPQLRRRLLDIEIGQINPKYLYELSKFKKILKERNELLKNNDFDSDILNIITNELAISNSILLKYRIEYISIISQLASEIYNSIANERLEIYYIASVIGDSLEFFKNKTNFDIYHHKTNYGIHRDDLKFKINGFDSELCSQGQQRTIILSMKLAFIEYIKRYKNDQSIILLDDVFSELDINRQIKLLDVIKNYQTFITTNNLEILKDKIKDCQVFELSKKEIKELC